MSYQIGTVNCLNQNVSWLPQDPNFPRCESIGQTWYFAAGEYGNRLSGFYRSEGEVHAAMGVMPSFTIESLQLEKKAEYLQNPDTVWSSQEAYNTELAETQGEISSYNESTKTEDKPKFNIWYIVLPVIALFGYLLFRRK
ncbi:MAG: hypothetical protein FIB08_04175 [Candidatus Methanoperedens sp.]|nr:hypothetical protein [Candidatus Methanoperedens sp.]